MFVGPTPPRSLNCSQCVLHVAVRAHCRRVRVLYMKHFDKSKRDDEAGREVWLQRDIKELKDKGNDEPKWTSRGIGKLMITVRVCKTPFALSTTGCVRTCAHAHHTHARARARALSLTHSLPYAHPCTSARPQQEHDGKRALAVRSQESNSKMYLVNILLKNVKPSKQGVPTARSSCACVHVHVPVSALLSAAVN